MLDFIHAKEEERIQSKTAILQKKWLVLEKKTKAKKIQKLSTELTLINNL